MAAEGDEQEDRRWRTPYALVLAALAVTVALLTALSKVAW